MSSVSEPPVVLADNTGRASYTSISCGVYHLYSLGNDPEEVLRETFYNCAAYHPHRCAMYIFSDKMTLSHAIMKDPNNPKAGCEIKQTPSSQCGQKLADYIEKHQLGKIAASDEVKNPNSGNMIKTFIWQVHPENLKKWCIERHIPCYPLGTQIISRQEAGEELWGVPALRLDHLTLYKTDLTTRLILNLETGEYEARRVV